MKSQTYASPSSDSSTLLLGERGDSLPRDVLLGCLLSPSDAGLGDERAGEDSLADSKPAKARISSSKSAIFSLFEMSLPQYYPLEPFNS